MPSEPENPSEPDPEAEKAMSQLRAGIKRARVIVREAKQAIGHAPPEGAVLDSGAEEIRPPNPAD